MYTVMRWRRRQGVNRLSSEDVSSINGDLPSPFYYPSKKWRVAVKAALSLFVFTVTVLLLCRTAPADSRDSRISGDKPIIVGGDRAYPPYEFIDKDGNPAGYNVDLTRAIAELMGMKVQFRFGGWKEIRDAFSNGEIDLLEGISYSEERTKVIDFSVPHTIVHHAIFAREDTRPATSFGDLKGKEVIVFESGIMHDYLVENGYDVKIVLTETPAEALRLLASGKHDYAVVAMLPGMYLIQELQLFNLRPVAKNIAERPYCFAVKKGDTELLSRINEGLAILKKTGQYQAIYQKWLGVLQPPGVPWGRLIKYMAAVVVPLVLLLVGTIVWTQTLKKEVAIRTEELAREAAERKRAAEELLLHQKQLIQAHKMAALGILVSGVAHEINNPNGLILMNTPVIIEAFKDITPLLEEYYTEHGDFIMGGLHYSRMRTEILPMLTEMQDGAKRIKRIVEELKDFARRDDSGFVDSLNFNGVVQAAVRLVDNSIRKATNHFYVSYADNLPKIRGNFQRLEQVVVNLILNACQALPSSDRGVFVKTFIDQVSGSVILEVRDEGVGIAPEHLPYLTDPFFTTKREVGGTGLGLSVSATIVKEHGGSLQFTSSPGKGTTVMLTLLPEKEESS